MAKKTRKAFVVDASVARSAGSEQATYPASIDCRDFLLAMRDEAFGIVMSPDISEEWINHASRFSRKWLVQMNGRKRVVDIGDVKNDLIRKRIHNTTTDSKQQAAMEKDCLLLEAALTTDKTVFSLDETIRYLFRAATATVHEIKQVHWANPALLTDDVLSWLKHGAPTEKKRQLGYTEQ